MTITIPIALLGFLALFSAVAAIVTIKSAFRWLLGGALLLVAAWIALTAVQGGALIALVLAVLGVFSLMWFVDVVRAKK